MAVFQGSAPKRKNIIPRNPMRLLSLVEIFLVGCMYVIVPRSSIVASSCILVVCNKNSVSIQRIAGHVHCIRLSRLAEDGLRIDNVEIPHLGVGCICVSTWAYYERMRKDVSVLHESKSTRTSHCEPRTSISHSHELHVMMITACFVYLTSLQ